MVVDEESGPSRAAGRTPVTVLTGALGAGKTTLLKYILEKPHGYRVAVIQNEFSEEMGIESPLITDASGDTFKDIYELPNGCLCCSAKDGLVSMIDHLLEQRQRFDYVLVEATGVADPESICEIFWVDDGLGCHVYLDGVVTLVDGKNALSSLGHEASGGGDAGGLGLEKETVKQVACADVLILNKGDLSSEAERARIAAHLATMNPTAVLLESVYSVVPLDRILGIKAFDRSRLAESLAGLSLPDRRDHHHGNGVGLGHVHAGHSPGGHDAHDPGCKECQDIHSGHGHLLVADHGVESFLLRGDSPATLYDSERVRSWMADVLWEGSAGGVYRCKGLFQGPADDDENSCSVDGSGGAAEQRPLMAYALQGVGRLFEIEEVPHAMPVAQSKFLFIGKGLQWRALEEGLRRCLWSANESSAS